MGGAATVVGLCLQTWDCPARGIRGKCARTGFTAMRMLETVIVVVVVVVVAAATADVVVVVAAAVEHKWQQPRHQCTDLVARGTRRLDAKMPCYKSYAPERELSGNAVSCQTHTCLLLQMSLILLLLRRLPLMPLLLPPRALVLLARALPALALLAAPLLALRLMDKILHDLKDSKLWELWYIPYNG